MLLKRYIRYLRYIRLYIRYIANFINASLINAKHVALIVVFSITVAMHMRTSY